MNIGTSMSVASKKGKAIAALISLLWLLVATVGSPAMAGGSESDGAQDWRSKGLYLVMFEQKGCHFCRVWEQNIGVSYHKTPEGRFAPLKKIDLHSDKLANVRPVIYTPTFVLLKDGQEVGRLTGFTSEDFFWGLLAPMLRKYGFRP